MKREEFEKQAKRLMQNGAKVCPCCHYDHLILETDDDHCNYILECVNCHVGIARSLMRQIRNHWNHRVLEDERINRITHNITCEWYDTESQETYTITLDDEETGDNQSDTDSV